MAPFLHGIPISDRILKCFRLSSPGCRPRVQRADAARWKRRRARDLYSMHGICVTVVQNRKHDSGVQGVILRSPAGSRDALSRFSATCLTISMGISLGERFGLDLAIFQRFCIIHAPALNAPHVLCRIIFF